MAESNDQVAPESWVCKSCEASEIPDISKLGKEVSEEAVKQVDDAITDVKKRIEDAKHKFKQQLQKMEETLKALNKMKTDLTKELKKSKK